MSLKNTILSELNKQFNESEPFDCDIPRYNHGDYSLNVAFKLAKKFKKNPHVISEDISNTINANKSN